MQKNMLTITPQYSQLVALCSSSISEYSNFNEVSIRTQSLIQTTLGLLDVHQ